MRWAVWIGLGALLAAGCGGKERLPTSGASPAKDGSPPPASNDGGSDAATDAGQRPGGDLAQLGSSCTRGADCRSGFCADGVCCNIACTGPCVTCAPSGRLGTCFPVDDGAPEPHGLCVNQGAASCGLNGTCDGVGGCAFYPAGTACASSTCTGAVLTLTRTCDGLGACGAGTTIACSPFQCLDGSCYDDCVSSAECSEGATCINGICEHSETAACVADDECASGHCAQGVCCASACAAPCSSCALPGTVGTCAPVANADAGACG